MGLFESKTVINIWFKNTFDNSNDFLLKFSLVFFARSSIIKHQQLTPILQSSKNISQLSISNLPKLKTNSIVRFLLTRTLYLNKLLLRTVRQRQYYNHLKFEKLLQIWKSVNFGDNMSLLNVIAGERGLLIDEGA